MLDRYATVAGLLQGVKRKIEKDVRHAESHAVPIAVFGCRTLDPLHVPKRVIANAMPAMPSSLHDHKANSCQIDFMISQVAVCVSAKVYKAGLTICVNGANEG